MLGWALGLWLLAGAEKALDEASLRAKVAGLGKKSVQPHIELSLFLLQGGRHADAARAMAEAARRFPDAAAARQLQGWIAEQSGDLKAAVPHYRQAVYLDES